jgi:hypothetical protein
LIYIFCNFLLPLVSQIVLCHDSLDNLFLTKQRMKKHMLLLALLGVLAIGLSGCLGVPEEEKTAQDEPVVTDEPVMTDEELTVAEMIEDFDSYVESDVDMLVNCPEEYEDSAAFIENAMEDGVKEIVLLDSDEYGMTLYLTANPDGVNTETFKDTVDKCIDGVGMNGPLKAYDEYLLWGWPMCSSGFAPTEDQPGYEDFQKCVDISEDIVAYLEDEGASVIPDDEDVDTAAFECPEEGETVDCEPLIGEGGEEREAYCQWVQENCEGFILAL